MYCWTPEMIRFLEDAASKSEYYRCLSRTLAEQLSARGSVCDVGCGLGHLAELLCASFPSVTAIDCSEPAIGAFRARLGGAAPKNLRVLCTDAFALPETLRFDAMIFCYFGSLPEILRVARNHCAGSVIVIRRNYGEHRFDLGGHLRPHAGAADTLRALRAKGIDCRYMELALEFGQPLRSQEDALRFFRLYLRDPAQTVDWQVVAPRLTETGDVAFPYYYPQKKSVGVIQFDAAQIPPQ